MSIGVTKQDTTISTMIVFTAGLLYKAVLDLVSCPPTVLSC